MKPAVFVEIAALHMEETLWRELATTGEVGASPLPHPDDLTLAQVARIRGHLRRAAREIIQATEACQRKE